MTATHDNDLADELFRAMAIAENGMCVSAGRRGPKPRTARVAAPPVVDRPLTAAALKRKPLTAKLRGAARAAKANGNGVDHAGRDSRVRAR